MSKHGDTYGLHSCHADIGLVYTPVMPSKHVVLAEIYGKCGNSPTLKDINKLLCSNLRITVSL